MTTKEKAQTEIDLAITALFHEAGRFNDLVWSLQLAPPPAHQYHRKEHLDDAVVSLAKCDVAMKALLRNLKKVAA
jgi:hypothetical protein